MNNLLFGEGGRKEVRNWLGGGMRETNVHLSQWV
jgi:hypothetical protein